MPLARVVILPHKVRDSLKLTNHSLASQLRLTIYRYSRPVLSSSAPTIIPRIELLCNVHARTT